MMEKDGLQTYLPLTLEAHFEMQAKESPAVENLHSLWVLLRKDLEDMLPLSRNTFVHYSLHDATHSRSVIQAIERFLGEDRIKLLSATDTFMMLLCAYAHDYGMAMSFAQINEALGSAEFTDFLERQRKVPYTLGAEEINAVDNLLAYIKDKKASVPIQELYFSIMLIMQSYLRPTHWKGVERIWGDFCGLLEGRLNGRFIRGLEGVVEICEAHGKPFKDLMKLEHCADGVVADDFHPRFIAAMLRLGDLLDLDNGRFPRWFVSEISRDKNLIPKLSSLHYRKHEAISHLLVTPKEIQVIASCYSDNEGYAVASIVSEWFDWLDEECRNQILHWSEIAQNDFGQPPRVTKKEIMIDGKTYTSGNYTLQMRMSQNRVMDLLKGSNIYGDHYVFIRELIQNAVDASLLQLWYDITHNRYVNIGISKYGHNIGKDEKQNGSDVPSPYDEKESSLLEFDRKQLETIFKNYPIKVEVIYDKKENKVSFVVKDCGTGITSEDVRYMADIGTSKEKNERVMDIMKNMPRWLKPSGMFGIGLQSAFQVTDEIEFYTRRPNEAEKMIVFHSYGKNLGKIEIRELPPDVGGVYYDNAVPGTNVKITIDPDKLKLNWSDDLESLGDQFAYYDTQFDVNDLVYALFVELSKEVEGYFKDSPFDYFDIWFQPMETPPDGPPEKDARKRIKIGYFYDNQMISKGIVNQFPNFFGKETGKVQPFAFTKNTAAYIDKENCRIHNLTLRVGRIENEDGRKTYCLPEPMHQLYYLQYKFNRITNTDYIYPENIRKKRKSHAGYLDWDINILDNNPDKYLNIDRDRLREGAIDEEEFTEPRKLILEHWCEYLIERYKEREDLWERGEKERRMVFEKRGKGNEIPPRSKSKIFSGEIKEIISLILLFYQNVSPSLFRRFLRPYQEYIAQSELLLDHEAFTVENLWDENAMFRWRGKLQIVCNDEEKKPDSAGGEERVLDMTDATIRKLPHRLIHIESISARTNGEITYSFKLGHSNKEVPNMIRMDKLAQQFDCFSIMHDDKSHKFNWFQLVRAVFKPNARYPHLLVPKFPKTFKTQNFSLLIDHCIRWYILSPFDENFFRRYRKEIQKGAYSKKFISDAIAEHFKKSAYAKNCVEYVYKQTNSRCCVEEHLKEGELKEIILQEYTDFMIETCSLLADGYNSIKDLRKVSESKE